MATITKSQILKINSKCANGFRFDINKFQLRGDKDLAKNIQLSETKIVTATLYFQTEYKNFSKTGFQTPIMNVCVWTKTNESVMWSSGIGKFHKFEEFKVNRRSMSALQDITALITDDMIMQMANEGCQSEL